jgi:hypothetical protein
MRFLAMRPRLRQSEITGGRISVHSAPGQGSVFTFTMQRTMNQGISDSKAAESSCGIS